MTICIAAIADDHESIISCVDTKVSAVSASSEPAVGMKIRGLRGWTMLSSGTTCYSERFIAEFRRLLRDAPDNEPDTVRNILEKVRASEITKFCEEKYLTPFGLKMPEFLTSTTGALPADLSRSILDYSDQYDVEIIVSGWGDKEANHVLENEKVRSIANIFSVGRDGVLTHGDDGFHTAGSGKWAAQSTLMFFNYESRLSLPQQIYFVAAAKLMAERDGHVGRVNTIMRVAHRVGSGEWSGFFVKRSHFDAIRRTWEEMGAPRMPERAEDEIVGFVKEYQGSVRTSAEYMGRHIAKALGATRKD